MANFASKITSKIEKQEILASSEQFRTNSGIAKGSATPPAEGLPKGTVVAIETASGKVVAYDNAGVDGSENPVGVLVKTATANDLKQINPTTEIAEPSDPLIAYYTEGLFIKSVIDSIIGTVKLNALISGDFFKDAGNDKVEIV